MAAAVSSSLQLDGLIVALQQHSSAFAWSAVEEDDVSDMPVQLRELFLQDQQLLQGCGTAHTPWAVHSHCTRRRRQHGCTDAQQQLKLLQQQAGSLAASICDSNSQKFSHEALEQLPIVKLRVLSSSSAGTFSSSFCSRSGSLVGAAAPGCARTSSTTDATAVRTSCDGTRVQALDTAECLDLGQRSSQLGLSSAYAALAQPAVLPHLPEQQHQRQQQEVQEQPQAPEQQHAGLQAHSSSTSVNPAGQQDVDVSAQKAVAQARFAEQQCLQAAGCASTCLPADVLQQEQALLAQPGFQTRMFASVLLCNLLCCLMVLAAKGPLGRFVGSSAVQWPLLLALSAAFGWLFMAKLRPLQFAHAAVEQQYAMRSRSDRCLLDLWFSLAGCSGVLAALRSETTPASPTTGPQPPAAATLVALQTALPVLLIAVLLSGALLLLTAPRTYGKWREQLLFVGKVAMVSGMVVLQPTQGTFWGVQAGPEWLSFLGHSRAPAQAASVLLAMSAVQAFLLLTLMVRTSAYLPMQLIHVTALLVTVASSGSSGVGMVLYAVQLLACGLWVPTCILMQLELSSRRTFLARHLPSAKKVN